MSEGGYFYSDYDVENLARMVHERHMILSESVEELRVSREQVFGLEDRVKGLEWEIGAMMKAIAIKGGK